jgi:ABC-2 type transport system ATP-binding protein
MTANAPSIRVRDLHKTYVVAEREAGARAALKSLIRRRKAKIAAVDGISFEVDPGEIV